MKDVVLSYAIHFLTGDFPYCKEIRSFLHGYSGFMAVRKANDKNGADLNWFHRFFICVLSSFGGAILTPMWLGKPSSIIATDMTMLISLAVNVLVFYTPFDMGYKLGKLFPIKLILTIGSSLFKTMGMIGFCTVAFDVLKTNPAATEYYPIPIFGPIIWASLLGNMGPFFMKGFHVHLEKGMPYPFQAGLFWMPFYHFYVHDTEGPIGNYLRQAVDSIPWIPVGLDNRTFALLMVSTGNQLVGILQMSELLGSSFSPFVRVYNALFAAKPEKKAGLPPKNETNNSNNNGNQRKKPASKRKKKQ